MLPVSDLFLTEGVWSFVKNSIASILGRRKQVNVKPTELDAEERIEKSEAIHKRLTPRPLASTRKNLGIKYKLLKQK